MCAFCGVVSVAVVGVLIVCAVFGAVAWVLIGRSVSGAVAWVLIGCSVSGAVAWVLIACAVSGAVAWVLIGCAVSGAVTWVLIGRAVSGALRIRSNGAKNWSLSDALTDITMVSIFSSIDVILKQFPPLAILRLTDS